MTIKEKFLQIESCDEFYKRRSEFNDLDVKDPEVLEHFAKITPNATPRFIDGEIIEAF